MRLELKAVKAEPRGSKTAEQLMPAEASRLEAAVPQGPRRIVLASQSPRRRQLLEQLGVRHELLLADHDEDAESLEAEIAGELPLAYVERVTRAKLHAAQRRRKRRGLATAPILCSDTTVAIGRPIPG